MALIDSGKFTHIEFFLFSKQTNIELANDTILQLSFDNEANTVSKCEVLDVGNRYIISTMYMTDYDTSNLSSNILIMYPFPRKMKKIGELIVFYLEFAIRVSMCPC